MVQFNLSFVITVFLVFIFIGDLKNMWCMGVPIPQRIDSDIYPNNIFVGAGGNARVIFAPSLCHRWESMDEYGLCRTIWWRWLRVSALDQNGEVAIEMLKFMLSMRCSVLHIWDVGYKELLKEKFMKFKKSVGFAVIFLGFCLNSHQAYAWFYFASIRTKIVFFCEMCVTGKTV